MNLSSKYLIKLLEANGYVFRRSKGSHHIYYKASAKKTVVVPVHGNKDLAKGTFFSVLRQAEISTTNL